MHGDDLAQWLMRIAVSSSPDSQVFNVGSDEAISIHDLGRKLARYFGVDANLAAIDSDVVNRYVPSIDKAKTQLGLTLTKNIDESIQATIEAIRNI